MMQGFLINTIPDPQAIARVLEPFSQRSLVPTSVAMAHHGDRLTIRVVADLPEAISALILARLDAMVVVVSVQALSFASNAKKASSKPYSR